jgi:predicted acetyltransferase
MRFSGMLVRHPEWWIKNIISDLHTAIYYDDKNQPKGYILYSIKELKMDIEEFVALNGEARKGLCNFICQHDSMIKELVITTYERDPLIYSLQNPSIKIELLPYFMVRILDAEGFLKRYPFNWAEIRDGISIKISDPYASWNDKTFFLKDKKVYIIEKDSKDQKGITLSINALSTILFGYKRPCELYEIGHIIGSEDEIQKLENVIPQQQTFFNDFF